MNRSPTCDGQAAGHERLAVGARAARRACTPFAELLRQAGRDDHGGRSAARPGRADRLAADRSARRHRLSRYRLCRQGALRHRGARRHRHDLRARRSHRRSLARRATSTPRSRPWKKSTSTSSPRCTRRLQAQGDYRILVTPDHPTPLRTKTHSHGFVPFAIGRHRHRAPTASHLRRSRSRPVGARLRRRLEVDALLSGHLSWRPACLAVSFFQNLSSMPLIVQKFGGTSVADSQKILAAARKAIRAQQEGNQVVMVVSAMGNNTDVLVDLANEITDQPPAREMDMLLSTGEQVSVALMAMAIHSLGHKAVSLTGAQIGIRTDSTHTKARIQSISTERMRKLLGRRQDRHRRRLPGDRRGFQHHHAGPRRQRHHGRGAGRRAAGRRLRDLHRRRRRLHDRSARAARSPPHVSRVSYDEMLELASLGAGVMHSRSIEFAKKFAVPIHVRSSFTDMPGTMIVAQPEAPDQPVGGAALDQERSPRHDSGRARSARHEPGDLLARSPPSNLRST